MEFGYEKLDVAKLAKILIKEIYAITKTFPKHEQFGLMSQLRRAVISVLLNIAEGSNRKGKKEFHQFVRVAIASLVEVDCAIKIGIDLGYIKEKRYEIIEPTIKELYFKLIGLSKYLLK
jgi:four helix bundle protein